MNNLKIIITEGVLLIAIFLYSFNFERESCANLLPVPQNVHMGFSYKKFSSYDEYVAFLKYLEGNDNVKVELKNHVTTMRGDYPLYWVRVGNPNKPAFMIVSVIHAKNEWQGAHITLNFLEKIISESDNQKAFNAKLLENFSIIAVPIVNVWGYFASVDGKHHNGHEAIVDGIENADWHDMSNYGKYYGVNLNRNFDCNWQNYPSLPWSVKKYWNGKDYGVANYFMMPYYLDDYGKEVYDPQNKHPNHILRPDYEYYDYKGKFPFSESETRLIRDLFSANNVIGFIDIHLMNEWNVNNVSYSSNKTDRDNIVKLVDAGIESVNARNNGESIAKTLHYVIEEYDSAAPYALNWAQSKKNVKSFGWEIGTGYDETILTDAYMEMIYRSIYWMQSRY